MTRPVKHGWRVGETGTRAGNSDLGYQILKVCSCSGCRAHRNAIHRHTDRIATGLLSISALTNSLSESSEQGATEKDQPRTLAEDAGRTLTATGQRLTLSTGGWESAPVPGC